MNGLDNSQRLDNYLSLKRRSWESDQHQILTSLAIPSTTNPNPNYITNNSNNKFAALTGLLRPRHDNDDLVSAVEPAVTVVLEGRSICHRISLHNHGSYKSLAKALRLMFVDGHNGDNDLDLDLDLSNAVPGHLIAYEDFENDLLLAGDLNWKDFVRVAKRIRILPAKSNSRKSRSEVV